MKMRLRLMQRIFLIWLPVIFVTQLTIISAISLLHSTNAREESVSSQIGKNYPNSQNVNNITNLSNNKGHSEHPKLTVMGNNVSILWTDDSSGTRDLYFRKSSDEGCNFGPAIDVSNQSGASLDPQIVTSGNRVYLIWEHTPGNNGEIFFTRSIDSGASFESARNIGNNTGFNGFPQMTASGNNVYLVWHDATKGILFTRSTDNGASFESARIIGNSSGSNEFPQITASGNKVYVLWINNSDKKYGQIFFARSTNDGVSFEKPSELGRKRDHEVGRLVFNPRLTVDSQSNKVYVIWQSGIIVHQYTGNINALISDILYKRSTNNGTSFESTINLSNYSAWSINPQIAAYNNSVYVVWTDNSTGNYEINFKNHGILKDCNPKKVDNFDSFDRNLNAKTLKNLKIGFVDPTFTFAAYDNSFYLFYGLKKPDIGASNFTGYTDLLSSKIPSRSSSSFSRESDDIMLHLKWLLPEANIDFLTDQDVHNGSLIISQNGTNLYDVILLSHQEYVTQQEYNNLKRFVSNGGTLILLDGNVFYAEVKYDESSDSVTLVKGHDWAFNGRSAWKSVPERWANETTQWVGSNYLCCYSDEIIFRNDPFGIEHDEEQYITNPRAKILLDYNATENKPNPRQFVIATYVMGYGNGQVLTFGLYTDDLKGNQRFWNFFDSLIFEYVLGDKLQK